MKESVGKQDIPETEGPFSGELTPLNEYVKFPLELRSKVLRGVMVAAKNAPTEREWIMKELETTDLVIAHGGEEFDEFYGVLSDLFIKSIDSSYRGNVSSLSPTLTEYRIRFYKMIRHLSSEKLYRTSEAILEYNRSSKKA